MTAPRQQPLKHRQTAQLKCIFLRGGVAHVSPSATIQELLHYSPTPEEITLQQRIKNAAENFTDKHKNVMNTMRQEMMVSISKYYYKEFKTLIVFGSLRKPILTMLYTFSRRQPVHKPRHQTSWKSMLKNLKQLNHKFFSSKIHPHPAFARII